MQTIESTKQSGKMNKDFNRTDFQSDSFVSFTLPDQDHSNAINTGNQRDKLEFLSAGYEFNENSVASESLNMGGFRGGTVFFIYI
jgi:hypothetical protein